jgi:myo-inositol-1(or 4)-monophosphatase
VSSTERLIDSLLVTGFPYDIHQKADAMIPRFKQCLIAAQGVRRLGSAALDLCYVACGRFDAFWEENLKPWDVAAGQLIVKEAGGKVTDFSDQAYQPALNTSGQPVPDELLATNKHIHAEMVSLMQIEDPS